MKFSETTEPLSFVESQRASLLVLFQNMCLKNLNFAVAKTATHPKTKLLVRPVSNRFTTWLNYTITFPFPPSFLPFFLPQKDE